MGQDGNTIEIEIDAAATVAAAKTAGEANAKLVKFDQALGLFRDNVGLVSKTTEDVASVMGDFNTILGKFADNLVTNLADMQTSVVQKIEPHLERELENMVNRVLNKVEAKTGTTGESRSRSEAKQGAAAPAVPVTPAGQRVGVSQDTDYKKPDYRIKENIVERIIADFDEVTGKQIERIHTTRNTRVIKDDHDQYEDDEGNLVDKTSTVTTYTSEVNKANKIIAEGAKVEKDRGIAIRKEITGALIGLHVMKVVSQYSAVANAGFMMVFAALGHLLNNILLPMMPAFIIFAQVLHTVANVIQMLPMPIRQLIGALLIWKATSMLIAAMPIKDIVDGMRGLVGSMKDAGSGLKGFLNLVRAFIDFMNSGQGKGAVSWIGSGVGSLVGKGKQLLGKRAGGGPVLGHGAYIVGEKGPEIFVPKTSGSIIPNHKIGRAEGGDVEGGMSLPFGGDIMGNLGAGLGVGGLAYLMTGSPLLSAGLAAGAGMLGPEGIANGIASIVSSDIGSNFIASINVMTGMLAGILAPLAPMMGILGAVVGVVTGSRAAMGGGDGGKTADTVAAVGNAQLKQTAAMSYGVQNAVGGTGRGTNKVLSMILMRLGGCLNVAPCVPGIFGSTEIITALALIPGAISLAIGDLVAKIRYTIETVGEKPVVEDVTARITYNVETVGEKPTATDIDAKIRYTLETTGIEPVATDKTAKITYTEEIARTIDVTDITARVQEINTITETKPVRIVTELVDITETGITRAIDVANVATSAVGREVVFRSIVTAPTMQDIISRVGETNRILIDNPAEMVVTAREFAIAEWNAIIEAKSVADPAKITTTLLADGTGIPTIDLYGRVLPELDVSGVSGTPVDIIGNLNREQTITALRATVGQIEEITRFYLTTELDRESLINVSNELEELKADYGKLMIRAEVVSPETPIRFPVELYVPQGALAEVPNGVRALVPVTFESGTFNPGGNWEKIGENTYRYRGTTSANVEFKGGSFNPGAGWEKVGENLWRRVAPMEAPVEPRVSPGFDWRGVAKSAVGGFVLAFGIALAEYDTTGKIDWGRLFLGLGTAALVWTGAEYVLVGLATSLAGATGAAAVTTAFASVGALLVPLILAPVAYKVGTDFQKTIVNIINAQSFSESDFEGFAGKWAYRTGTSMGNALNNWLKQNFKIDLTHLFQQDGPEGDILRGMMAGAISVTLGPDVAAKFLEFNNNLKTTLAGGVPIDVKIDVDSVTSVVQQIGEASNLGGYTGPVVSDPGVGGGQPPINDPIQIGGNDPMGPYAPPVEPPVAYDPNNPEGLPTWVDPNPPSQCPEGQYFDSSLGVCVGGYGYAVGGRPPVNVPSLVGERGPELFIPDSSPTSVGGGGGGNTINFSPTFNVTTNNPRELTDTVMKELKMELARVKM